ncbi:MAG: DUF2470 domain-containing protein, partial [Rhodobacterales bacterium]|nr:DUF2470 domain-containing protein [Rhodobacterales bacterium]
YAGFGDFAFYRLAVERAHLVGGFARAHWIGAAQWPPDPAAVAAIGALADGAVAHLNADHPDAATLYATRLLGRRGTGWTVTGVDPDGLDLRREDRFARLDFPAPVADGDALRTALAKRSDQARGQGS